MSTDGFKQHCREIARSFLLTAVVVDDELSVSADGPVHGGLTRPRRGAVRLAPPSVDPLPRRPLKVEPVTRSFAGEGMVCGVVSPQRDDNDHDALAKAVARADIVILDWRLSRVTGANALPLLARILTNDPRHRLRLIAFYTDELDLGAIRRKIAASLDNLSEPGRVVSASNDRKGAIDFGPCRILVYAKSDSRTLEPRSIVKEEALAAQLIADFADMVEGLLPSLVLTALAAVRENVYQVLERFGRDLDPAFLAHRACLPHPLESEQHMVEQIASELHGIMDEAVGRTTPAGIEAIKLWLQGRFGDNPVVFGPNKEMSRTETLAMLTHGMEEQPGPLRKGKKKGKDFPILSYGFSQDADNGPELDRRLASTMSFRQVHAETSRQLSMGTVVRRLGEENVTLLCVTPRCDSVRLSGRSAFLFLPLVDPKSDTPQIVVPNEEEKHERKTISLSPSQWCIEDFEPDPERQCVVAQCNGPDQPFTFKEVGGKEYLWVGELKPEFAQSIAQAIAERMYRIPLNKSEWLRRSERVGKRAG